MGEELLRKIESLAKDFAEQLLKLYENRDNALLNAPVEDHDFIMATYDENEELLWDQFKDDLEELGLEVDLDYDIESHNYFNAPGSPRAYNFYNCTMTIQGILDPKTWRAYFIYVYFDELQYPNKTEYRFRGVYVEPTVAINAKRTPFAERLASEIPWLYIRPLWANQIRSFVRQIAEAELEGRLAEAIREVEEKLKAGMWVYDYQHFYNALQRTKAAFNIA